MHIDICIAEEEGIEEDPIEVCKFVNFIKIGNYHIESFFMLTDIERWQKGVASTDGKLTQKKSKLS